MRDRRDAIAKAMDESALCYFEDQTVLTEQFSCVGWLREIDNAMQRILDTKGPLYKEGPPDPLTKRPVLLASRLGETLLYVLDHDLAMIERIFPMHEFHPRYTLFKAETDRIRSAGFGQWAEASVLNECVARLRQDGTSEKFKCKRKNHERSGNKNYLGLRRYILGLILYYSKLLVLRIDFNYRMPPHGRLVSLKDPVTYEEAVAHREALVAHLHKGKLGKVLAGYAWRTEHGGRTSFHHHLLIMLNGQMVHNAGVIGKLLADHWNHVITDGKGRAHICRPESYARPGIGEISHSDEAKISNLLNDTAIYLTKPDLFLRLLAPDAGKTFSKGSLPKRAAGARGRPRKSSYALGATTGTAGAVGVHS